MVCSPVEGMQIARWFNRRAESPPLSFRLAPWTFDSGHRTITFHENSTLSLLKGHGDAATKETTSQV
jgi:hypothetical protein